MTQVARGRADQLGDFMLQLELAAVDLDHVLFRAVQRVGQRFDGLGFAGAGGSEQQENAHGTTFRSEASLEHLHVGNDQPRGVGWPTTLRDSTAARFSAGSAPACGTGACAPFGLSTAPSGLIVAAADSWLRGPVGVLRTRLDLSCWSLELLFV